MCAVHGEDGSYDEKRHHHLQSFEKLPLARGSVEYRTDMVGFSPTGTIPSGDKLWLFLKRYHNKWVGLPPSVVDCAALLVAPVGWATATTPKKRERTLLSRS